MSDTPIHESRRRRRDFIRVNHPDRGGDPELFIAGLRAFGPDREQVSGPLPAVVIVRRQPWLTRLVLASGHRLRRRSGPARVH